MRIFLLDTKEMTDIGRSPVLPYVQHLVDEGHEVSYAGQGISSQHVDIGESEVEDRSFRNISRKDRIPFVRLCAEYCDLVFHRNDIVDVWSVRGLWKILLIRLIHPSTTIVVRVWDNEMETISNDWMKRQMIRLADTVITESNAIRREVVKVRSRAIITVPYGRSYVNDSSKTRKVLRAYGLESEKFLLGVADVATARDELFRTVRVYERLVGTNRIANNIPLVLIHPEFSSQRDRSVVESLRSTQELLRIIVAPDEEVVRAMMAESYIYLASCRLPDEDGVRDASGFGRRVVAVSSNMTPTVRDFCTQKADTSTTLSARLSYAFNVPEEQIVSDILRHKRRVRRRYSWTSIGKRSIDIYRDAIARRRSESALWRVAHQGGHRYV